MALFTTTHFMLMCLLQGFWTTIWILKAQEEEGWVLKQHLVAEVYLLLKYCIYCVSMPSLHRESTDSLIIVHTCYTIQDLLIVLHA